MENTKYCTNCGTQITEGQAFCAKCGTKNTLSVVVAQQTPIASTNPPVLASAPPPDSKSLSAHFVDCVTKKYAVFSGRTRRREYWGFTLFFVLIQLACGPLVGAVGLAVAGEEGIIIACNIFGLILWLVLLLPVLGVTVRRLHDIGKGGWWASIILFPLVFSFLQLMAHAADGNEVLLGLLGLLVIVLLLVGFVWGIIAFVFMLRDGDRGPNAYGPDPKFNP